MKVAVLTGGVGGARFLRGVVDVVDPASVTAIVNVGDDLEVLGLSVSPDLDSVLYALAGIADEERGWGRADETWNALATVESLGGESWFASATVISGCIAVRTQALRDGVPLSAVTARLARGARRGDARSCPRPTGSCAPGSTRRTEASPSRSGSSPARTVTRSTAFAAKARPTRGRHRACSKRCTKPT